MRENGNGREREDEKMVGDAVRRIHNDQKWI